MKKATTLLILILTFSMFTTAIPYALDSAVNIEIEDPLFTTAATPGSNVVVVRVSDDADTVNTYPDTNFGSGDLYVGRDQFDDIGRTWMKFNLSHIPREAHFTRATVNLFVNGGSATLDEPIGVYLSDNVVWTEDTITWNTEPTYDPTPLDVIDSPASPNMFVTAKWYEWEITPAVIQSLNEDGILTLLIRQVNEDLLTVSAKSFNSRETSISGSENTIPNIALEYSIPSTSGLEVDGFSSSPEIDYIKSANPELSWTLTDADLNDFQKNYEVEVWDSPTYDSLLLDQENNTVFSVVHDTAGAGSSPSGIFSSYEEIREQYKWPASMISDSGVVDKLYFEVDQETGETYYEDLAIYMICVEADGLTAIFEDNYDGRTPIQVLNRSSYTASIKDGYVIFDIENLFVIQSSMNLIIEIRHSGSSGTNIDGEVTAGGGTLCTTGPGSDLYANSFGTVVDTWTQGLKLELVTDEVLSDGVSTGGFPFNLAHGNSLRVQFKYNQSLISNVGIIDRILFPSTGFEDVTFLNLRVYLVETPVEGDLSHVDMDSNYGGQTPVLVLNQSLYTVQNFGKMMVIDVNNTFYYSGTNDLLIELRFSNTISGSQMVKAGSNRGVYEAWDTYIDGHDTIGPDLILDFVYDATTFTYSGTSLVNGTRYYWRARTSDSMGVWSPWETDTFKYEILTSLPAWSNFVETPEPVEFGDSVTVSIDVIHTSGIASVEIEYDGVNHTMTNVGETFSYTWTPTSTSTNPYTIFMKSQSGTWNTLSDNVLVVDTTAPEWTSAPTDKVLIYGEAFSLQLSATDLSGIAEWTINDEVNFDIINGLVTNKTTLVPGGYSLEVTVTDNEGNSLSATFRVAVLESLTIPTTTPTTIPTTNSTSPGEPFPTESSLLIIAALVGVIAVLVIYIVFQRRVPPKA